jgi:hypothetical protein
MGVIRGALVAIISILLFLSLFGMSTFLTMSLSLEYDILEPELTSSIMGVVSSQINTSDIDEQLLPMALYCENYSEYTFMQEVYNYTVPCELALQGSDAILEYIIQSSIEEAYYREYDCEFWECDSDDPLFLFSQHSKNYWQGLFYKCLIISVILAAALLLVMEKRINWPFLVGIILIVSGLLFLGIGWIFSLVSEWKYVQMVTLFFTKINVAFLYCLVIGVVLIGIGLVLKFLDFGNKITKIFGGEKVKEKVVVKEVPVEKKEKETVSKKTKTKASKKSNSSK